MKGEAGPKRYTAKFRALLAAYVGQAGLNASEAARMAGYAEPGRTAYRLRQKFPEAFEKAERDFRRRLVVQREEVEERIADLVRNPKHRDHYKAIELAAKMHGMLSEKVNITIERNGINEKLDELLKAMLASRAVHKGMAIEATAIPMLLEAGSSQQPKHKKQ